MGEFIVNKSTGDLVQTAGLVQDTFYGTIEDWNRLSTDEKKAYKHASISDSLDGNVMFPASKVIMSSGTSLANGVSVTKLWDNPSPSSDFAGQNVEIGELNRL